MKAILVFVAALSFAVAPFLTPGFGGFDPALYPIPQVDPPVQPAGYAFAIWGLIYAWLLVHAGYGLLVKADDRGWDAPRWWLFASLAVGTSWLSVAMLSPLWATILIFFMLGTAVVALFRAPKRDPWLAQVPLALYAGWLSAASFASLGLLGAGYGVAFGQVGWAYAAILAATLVAGLVQLSLGRTPFYGAAVVWALVAIAYHNGWRQAGVAAAALIGAGAIVATMWVAARRGARVHSGRSSAR